MELVAEESINAEDKWALCPDCQGRGRRNMGLSKKMRRRYEKELAEFEKAGGEGMAPVSPKAHLSVCEICNGSGLQRSAEFPAVDTENLPRLAIIGGGIG
ncbi:MAG: FAD-dependent monooxygenase, partial [Planctomycetes bacterium]|nr:FAD-dependent monooxygenase [Planctomycetota bacterium]